MTLASRFLVSMVLLCLALATPIANDTPGLRHAPIISHHNPTDSSIVIEHQYPDHQFQPDRGVHLGEVIDPR
ncbi:hypothetical protein BO86DRAFT_386732 [Aspergillus japonicus CBS 114.51]|uniref:Uncharacterized protein n=1 Tax=Aspergillus japonicus CBS 114.51 TaxID=1448312 RepID=A0A8T8X9F0_ASPJA|nr:hypothetical protein BO86DRAFT_386732 [Aspergillus japonicus CBS 114.51]RAH84655.1 hypothetical protein BO86DRAFT_386732 [Aspergillus japonicus CBS 114.51]